MSGVKRIQVSEIQKNAGSKGKVDLSKMNEQPKDSKKNKKK